MQVSAAATQALFERIAAERPGARDWQLVLGIFFKITCPTCAMTWPYLEKLYQAYGGAGFAFWGISQDARDVSMQFARKQGGTFPVLIDSGWLLSRMFAPQFVPTILLIGRDGQIAETIVGFDKAKLNHLSEIIAARLAAPAAMIASPDDGNPVSGPAEARKHLHPL